jgi:hypothetical protein
VFGIEHNAYSHTGFDIRRAVAAPDFDQWEASIPTSGIPADHEFRVILIKGPSTDFWVRDTERYHKTGKIACEATKTAHSATSIEIQKDVNRQFSYWLLIFPEHVVLDNRIFSEDATSIRPGYNGMKVDETETEIGQKLFGLVVFWRIGEVGGRRVGNGQPKPDATKLFN